MNDSLRAIILGVVEGLTEFLPISSTGHMILAKPLLRISEQDAFWTAFDIFIQVGAICAVLLYFWRRLLRLSLNRRSIDSTASSAGSDAVSLAAPLWHEHILVKLLVAFLPAAVIGLLAGDHIEAHLKTSAVVAGALIVGGLLIVLIERRARRPRYTDAGTIPLKVAFGIGLIQCVSMVPGTSRSAATIMGALLLGLSAPAAAEFSFFLAIPTMFAAGGYMLLKHRESIDQERLAVLGLGFSVAFVVALLVVAGFMRYIQTHKFTPFAAYRILVGAAVILALRDGWLHS